MTELPGAEPLRYAVLLADASGLKPGALAQALAPVLKVPAQDLLVPMRRCRGLVAEDASRESARAQAEALAAAGIEALAVPRSLLEDPPPAEPARALPALPRVQLLAAAVFRRATTKVVKVSEGPSAAKRAVQLGLSIATGLPLGMMGARRETEKTVESADLRYLLDVHAGGRRLRVDAADFDFSCLGERKGYDAPGNFRRLLETLAPGAERLNEGARGVLDARPVRELGYEADEDLDREGRWLLTLAALKKA